jgi:hypothetical protein
MFSKLSVILTSEYSFLFPTISLVSSFFAHHFQFSLIFMPKDKATVKYEQRK